MIENIIIIGTQLLSMGYLGFLLREKEAIKQSQYDLTVNILQSGLVILIQTQLFSTYWIVVSILSLVMKNQFVSTFWNNQYSYLAVDVADTLFKLMLPQFMGTGLVYAIFTDQIITFALMMADQAWQYKDQVEAELARHENINKNNLELIFQEIQL